MIWDVVRILVGCRFRFCFFNWTVTEEYNNAKFNVTISVFGKRANAKI